MTSWNDIVIRLRELNPERMLGLRPPYPPVVVDLDPGEMTLLRIRPRRGGRLLLEAHESRPTPEQGVPASLFQNATVSLEELAGRLQELFEASGTRPGRVSVVLPDNLAKVSLLHLPERPASRRQLDEIVRARVRRAVPFRIEDAAVSYQMLPGEKKGVVVLVTVVRRALVELYERAFERVGARAGLIDLSTPNLINLCRDALDRASKAAGDAALLNCTPAYFSLVIVRGEKLIFIRNKSFTMGEAPAQTPNGLFSRELANSFSYYREKLEGQGVGTVLVRSVGLDAGEVEGTLRGVGCATVQPIDPLASVELGEGLRIDPERVQRLAPAVGAAARGA